uniref:7-cyano-7-deazaguanine synthase n=1 Tax=uncultured Campylobacter sp. TaxID=218934 RepID=UPI00260D113B
MRALCVISGGMDSATCAYIARREGYEIVALHFDYDQRTMGKEQECFGKICDDLGVAKRFILDARFIAQIGGSALTDGTLPIRKGAAELCGAANSAGTKIGSAVNSKSARLDGQNSIVANSINAEIGGQNFAASNFMTSSAGVSLAVDSARDSCMQSGEILTQGGEASLGDNEISPQDGEISSQSKAEPQQGDKISPKHAGSEISPKSQNNKISSQSQSDKI